MNIPFENPPQPEDWDSLRLDEPAAIREMMAIDITDAEVGNWMSIDHSEPVSQTADGIREFKTTSYIGRFHSIVWGKPAVFGGLKPGILTLDVPRGRVELSVVETDRVFVDPTLPSHRVVTRGNALNLWMTTLFFVAAFLCILIGLFALIPSGPISSVICFLFAWACAHVATRFLAAYRRFRS